MFGQSLLISRYADAYDKMTELSNANIENMCVVI